MLSLSLVLLIAARASATSTDYTAKLNPSTWTQFTLPGAPTPAPPPAQISLAPTTAAQIGENWNRGRSDCRTAGEFASCDLFEGEDCVGEDLEEKVASSPADCCNLCSASKAGCLAFSWYSPSKCYLKKGCSVRQPSSGTSGKTIECQYHCSGEKSRGRVCVCGFLEFSSRCMARCNAFCDSEIQDGSCDQNHCSTCSQQRGNKEGTGSCLTKLNDICDSTSYCNWYDDYYPNTAYVTPGTCQNEKFADGNYCTRPGMLRGCPSKVAIVCAYGAKDRTQLIEPDSDGAPTLEKLQLKYFFQNECYAKAAGFSKTSTAGQAGTYTLGNCTGDNIYDASYVFSVFGNSPASSDIVYNGALFSVSGIFIPTYNSSYSEADCGCNWNDYDPVCLDTHFVDTTFWNLCFARCRYYAQQNPNSIYKSYFPPGFDHDKPEEWFTRGPCEEGCKTRNPNALACAEQGLSCDSSFGYTECVPTNRSQCGAQMDKIVEANAANGIPFQSACVLTWNPVASFGLWIEYSLLYAENCLKAKSDDFLYGGTCLDRCTASCSQAEKEQTICIWDTLTVNEETGCPGAEGCPPGEQYETNFCEASCKFSSVVQNANFYYPGPCPRPPDCNADCSSCPDGESEICNCLKYCDIGPGAMLCSIQSGELYGKRFLNPCAASCYDITDPDFLVSVDSELCPPEKAETTCDPIYPECCDVISEKNGPLLTAYGNCKEYGPDGAFHNFCDDEVTDPTFATQFPTVQDACPVSCGNGKCAALAAAALFCSGMSNDCCDLATQDEVLTKYGTSCGMYGTMNGEYEFCGEDELLADHPLRDVERNILFVKDVCRRTCNECDDCSDDKLNRQHMRPYQTLVGIYGDCKSYAPGKANYGFCMADEVDLKFIGNSNLGVHRICKKSCGTCEYRKSEQQRGKEMRDENINGLRGVLGEVVVDPGKGTAGGSCASLLCTPPGGAGVGGCDPNSECCNHYPIGVAVDDYGTDCSAFEYVRGRIPDLHPNCDFDLVTKPFLRNGELDYFFVGQKVKYACPLSCGLCESRCDAKNECCDYAGKTERVGPILTSGTCADYRKGAVNDGYCTIDLIPLQAEWTHVTVARVCERSCGCCTDEYYNEQLATEFGGCKDHSQFFIVNHNGEAQCKGQGRVITFNVARTSMNKGYCEAKCADINYKTEQGQGTGACYAFTYNPYDKICTIFERDADRVGGVIPTEPVTGINAPVNGVGKLVKCFTQAYERNFCSDPVTRGPKADTGLLVRDVCRYSCGTCSILYDASMAAKALS